MNRLTILFETIAEFNVTIETDSRMEMILTFADFRSNFQKFRMKSNPLVFQTQVAQMCNYSQLVCQLLCTEDRISETF